MWFGKKKLVVQQQILLCLLPDGSRVNRLRLRWVRLDIQSLVYYKSTKVYLETKALQSAPFSL